jgi:hypothetical protein
MNNIRDIAREPRFDRCARWVIRYIVNVRGNNSMTSAASMILTVGAAGKFARACFNELAAANPRKEA